MRASKTPVRGHAFPAAILAAAVAMLAGGAPAGAQYPGIIGADDRRPVTQSGRPWDAIGQVNIGGYRALGQCTGTLVRPNLVITAAHCLLNDATGKPHPLRHIHFLAGVRGGKHIAHAKAKCLRFLTGHTYVPQKNAKGVPLSAMFQDVAAITLEADLAVEPASTADPRARDAGEPLLHAAYPADRRFQLQAHMGCRLLQPNRPAPIWLNDCDTHPASSGGPVFVEDDGILRLAAVMVGAGRANNTAIPLSTWLELLDGKACRD
jgi:V8-like Glu-specific endopeptidase